MYVSVRWLGRHIDLDGLTAEQICDDLTLSTAEVEGLEPFAPHLADVTVATVTADATVDVHRVVKIDVVGSHVDTLPLHWSPLVLTLVVRISRAADRLELRTAQLH